MSNKNTKLFFSKRFAASQKVIPEVQNRNIMLLLIEENNLLGMCGTSAVSITYSVR